MPNLVQGTASTISSLGLIFESKKVGILKATMSQFEQFC